MTDPTPKRLYSSMHHGKQAAIHRKPKFSIPRIHFEILNAPYLGPLTTVYCLLLRETADISQKFMSWCLKEYLDQDERLLDYRYYVILNSLEQIFDDSMLELLARILFMVS